MLMSNYTSEFLNLKDVIITKVENTADQLHIVVLVALIKINVTQRFIKKLLHSLPQKMRPIKLKVKDICRVKNSAIWLD